MEKGKRDFFKRAIRNTTARYLEKQRSFPPLRQTLKTVTMLQGTMLGPRHYQQHLSAPSQH